MLNRFLCVLLMCFFWCTNPCGARAATQQFEFLLRRQETALGRTSIPFASDAEPLWQFDFKYNHAFTKKHFVEPNLLVQSSNGHTTAYLQTGYTQEAPFLQTFCSNGFLASARAGTGFGGMGWPIAALEAEPECFTAKGAGFAFLVRKSWFSQNESWLFRNRAEQYFKDFRVAIALYVANQNSHGTELSTQYTASWYFAPAQKAEAFYTRGRAEGSAFWNWGILLDWLVTQPSSETSVSDSKPLVGLFQYTNTVSRSAVQHSLGLGLRHEL